MKKKNKKFIFIVGAILVLVVALFGITPFSTIVTENVGLDPGYPFDTLQEFPNIQTSEYKQTCESGSFTAFNVVTGGKDSFGIDLPSYSFKSSRNLADAERVLIDGDWYTRYNGINTGDDALNCPPSSINVLNNFRGKSIRIKTISNSCTTAGTTRYPTINVGGCEFDLSDGQSRIETRPRVLNPEIVDVYQNDIFMCGVILEDGEPFYVSASNVKSAWKNRFTNGCGTNVAMAIYNLDQEGCTLDENEILVQSTFTESFDFGDLPYSAYWSKFCMEQSPSVGRQLSDGSFSFTDDERQEVGERLLKGEQIQLGADSDLGLVSVTIPYVVTIPPQLSAQCDGTEVYDLDKSLCVAKSTAPIIEACNGVFDLDTGVCTPSNFCSDGELTVEQNGSYTCTTVEQFGACDGKIVDGIDGKVCETHAEVDITTLANGENAIVLKVEGNETELITNNDLKSSDSAIARVVKAPVDGRNYIVIIGGVVVLAGIIYGLYRVFRKKRKK